MVDTSSFLLRYTNCWEDSEVLLNGLKNAMNGRILTIASGGDNSLALLSLQPELLCIVDVNPMQIWLTELKMIAVKNLTLDETLSFLGYQDSTNRLEVYRILRSSLSADAGNFFDKMKSKIASGIIHAGYLEKRMRFFSKYLLPFIHSKSICKELIRPKSLQEQIDFYKNVWETKAFVNFIKFCFSRPLLKLLAADPDFLNYVESGISQHILNIIKDHFSSTLCQDNLFLNYILLGNFQSKVPDYLTNEKFPLIKSRLDAIRFHVGFAESSFEQFGSFDGYNLSNIFEYLTNDEFKTLAKKLAGGSNKNADLVYWNLMVNKKLSDVNNDFILEDSTLTNPTHRDRGFIYKNYVHERLK